MTRQIIYTLVCMLLLRKACANQGNDTLTLSLQQVVAMAKNKSIESKQAITTKETKYWQYRTFRSNYQPQLSLAGTLPGYNKTFTQVVQPDGTIQFQPIHNDNSSLNLSFSQSIAATGATVRARRRSMLRVRAPTVASPGRRRRADHPRAARPGSVAAPRRDIRCP